MRIALLLSSLVFAACTVGEIGNTGTNNTTPDAGSGSNMGVDPNACMPRLTTPDPAHIHAAGGTSNKGQNCIMAGCHLNNSLGTGAPGYQFAGTVYAAGSNSATASAGAMVRVKSASLTTPLTTFTDADGNFFFPAGSLSGAFTATTDVCAGATVMPMTTQLSGGNGGGGGANSCNLCHTTGANAQSAPISL